MVEQAEAPESAAPGSPLRARDRHRGGGHPSVATYIKVAAVLAAITGLEVAIYYLESIRSLLVPLLFGFSAIKFSLVVLFFMHLKFDSRDYARVFVTGLAVAATVYTVVLVTFGVFTR
ncbi:MAG: cytochrome C oxidase subunit IV family protein [Actinomycetota bacterium]